MGNRTKAQREKDRQWHARHRKAEAMRQAQATKATQRPAQTAGARPNGRPPERDVGGTAETIAKQQPDPLIMLEERKMITRAQRRAGEAILGQWRVAVPPRMAGMTPGTGQPPHEDDIEKGEATYRRWCAPLDGRPSRLFRRCMVGPATIVQWMTPSDTPSGLDLDEKGALGVLKSALDLWMDCANEASKAWAARQRGQQQAA